MGAENDDSTVPCVSFKVPVRRGNPPTISKRHRNSSHHHHHPTMKVKHPPQHFVYLKQLKKV